MWPVVSPALLFQTEGKVGNIYWFPAPALSTELSDLRTRVDLVCQDATWLDSSLGVDSIEDCRGDFRSEEIFACNYNIKVD